MKKTIVIVACMLLLAAGVPLFAHGTGSDHGRFWKPNPHRWQGSLTHPALHGYHGWGYAPSRCPDGIPTADPSNPGNPQEDPGSKPGQDPGQPGDKNGDHSMGGNSTTPQDPPTGFVYHGGGPRGRRGG